MKEKGSVVATINLAEMSERKRDFWRGWCRPGAPSERFRVVIVVAIMLNWLMTSLVFDVVPDSASNAVLLVFLFCFGYYGIGVFVGEKVFRTRVLLNKWPSIIVLLITVACLTFWQILPNYTIPIWVICWYIVESAALGMIYVFVHCKICDMREAFCEYDRRSVWKEG